MAPLLTFCLCVLVVVYSTKAEPTEDERKAMAFLKKYQYMGQNSPDKEMASLTDEDALGPAVVMYKQMMGFNDTSADLTNEFMEWMEKPRCGRADMVTMRDIMKRRKKRYSLSGNRWSSLSLTYKFINYTPDLRRTDITNTIRRAFDAWAAVSPLSFREVSSSSRADIDIVFGARDHSRLDPETARIEDPFDGPGRTLAHAYYPRYGGNAHFDEDETWTINGNGGIDLFFVSIHEFGHSLGLDHSNIRSAIMFPTYLGYVPNLQLDSDDILGIQAIYGRANRPTTPRPTTTTTTRRTTTTRTTRATTTRTTTTREPTQAPSVYRARFCQTGTIDAITSWNGETLAFQGDLFAKLDSNGIVEGYPRPISSYWDRLENNIDAALYIRRYNRLYMFKGRDVWLYRRDYLGRPLLATGYPRDISRVFYRLDVDKVDAAFTWSGNGRAYIFANNEYYRIRNSYFTSIDRNYPRSLGVWGITSVFPRTDLISAVYSSPETQRTYFFTRTQLYRFNDYNFGFDEGYPREIASTLYGCDDTSDMEMQRPYDQFTNVPGVMPTDCMPGMADCTMETSGSSKSNISVSVTFVSLLICSIMKMLQG